MGKLVIIVILIDDAICNHLFNLFNSGMQFKLTCNRTCECDTSVFVPVCTSTGKTYFSACHAGCTNHTGVQASSLTVSLVFFIWFY